MRSIRCSARAALQTTYADDDLPSQICITYPPHPLVGQHLKVVGRQRNGRDLFWCVELPDGSHAKLPSSWTDQGVAPSRSRREETKTRTSPHALRELIHLLESLVVPHADCQACPKDPLKGGENGRAIGTVRSESDKDKPAQKTPAVNSIGDPAGGNSRARTDGDGSSSSCQGRKSKRKKGERR